MISGRLEKLFSEGYAEGWAFNSQSPHRPLSVEIRVSDGTVVAQGLANIYREDLASARLGLGWCAFRLRLAQPASELSLGALALHDKVSGLRIDFAAQMPCFPGNPHAGSRAEQVASFDPFVLSRISQLHACEDLFQQCLRARGPAAFVRTTYMYLLGRSADPESLELDAGLLEQGRLAPLQLMELIADTKEYRARPRELAAPNAPGFPFVEADDA
jgi:hypothetical protein